MAVLISGPFTGRADVRAATGDPVYLNEALLSHEGLDTTEFVELKGTPGASLAGLALLAVEGDSATNPGTVDFRLDFAPTAHLGGNGFYLVGNPQGLGDEYEVAPDVPIEIDERVQQILENGSQTLALVVAASAPPLGGVVTGGELVRNAVGASDGWASDQFFFGTPDPVVVGPDASGFLPPGLARLKNDESDSADDWSMTNFSLDGSHTPTAASPFNVLPSASCGPSVMTESGTPVSTSVTATDPDGVVDDFSLAVAPPTPGIGLANLVPAAVAGGTATADVVVGAGTPAGSYDVTVTASNDELPAQQASCHLALTVTPAATPVPKPEPTPVASGLTMDALHAMMDASVSSGAVAPSKVHLLAERLARAERFLAVGQTAAAAAQLQAFANQVMGLSPRWVAPDAAGAMAEMADALCATIAPG